MHLFRRTFLKCAMGSTVLAGLPRFAQAAPAGDYIDVDSAIAAAQEKSVVAGWNEKLMNIAFRAFAPPTVTSRALAIMNGALYDVWAYLDLPQAVGRNRFFTTAITRAQGADPQFQTIALTAAAAAVLKSLFPAFAAEITAYGDKLGLGGRYPWVIPATRVGEEAAQHMLNERAHDGSNQLGDLHPGAYSDYTGYTPVNSPTTMVDPDHWQPLPYQKCVTPFWGKVKPFALKSGDQFRPDAPPSLFSTQMQAEMQELLDLNANLTPDQILICEYWGDNSRLPWIRFAEMLAYRQGFSLGQEIRLFRALGFALHDAMVATWDAKMAYDFARPQSAIRTLFANRMLNNWTAAGVVRVAGSAWTPYLYTPPFPEYVSAHSVAGHAAAAVLEHFARGPVRFRQKASPTVTLYWDSFLDAAAQAGFSRRLGGIHFLHGDLNGRTLGTKVGRNVLDAWA
ncbi:hypothetical protein SAMN05428966_104394 [Massilia sp. PDC64]|nr:hypothetical protein SAMN05428966_104394 [Massilia sp. PDC64]